MKRYALLLVSLPVILLCEGNLMSADIHQIKAKYEIQLMKLPGVVSVGIGLDENKNQTIIVGLNRSSPDTETRILEILKGYRVRVQVIGEIKAQ